ncbi:MAG TPA: ATP synthase F0 subunit B [Terriglobia bacterium]
MKMSSTGFGRVLVLGLFLLLGLVWSGQRELHAAPEARWSAGQHGVPANPRWLLRPSPQLSALLEAEEGSGYSHEKLFKWINFLILAGVLVYFLRKPFADFFADRLDTIHEGLEEGRKALAASEAKLGEIEKKLANVQQEIAAFRVESAREMQAERERVRQAAEREGERILVFAEVQIEAAVRAAKLDLKRYAAGKAVELAETLVRERLDEPARRGLVRSFVADLKSSGMQN